MMILEWVNIIILILEEICWIWCSFVCMFYLLMCEVVSYRIGDFIFKIFFWEGEIVVIYYSSLIFL